VFVTAEDCEERERRRGPKDAVYGWTRANAAARGGQFRRLREGRREIIEIACKKPVDNARGMI
jgi:hypothetical protein